MLKDLAAILRDQTRIYHYDAQRILDIHVFGDLATVHLVWTLRVADRNGQKIRVIRENGPNVLRNQPDCTWKIRISHAYRESKPVAD